jgi:hypothetical protein
MECKSGQINTNLDMNIELMLCSCTAGVFGGGGMRGSKMAAMSKPTSVTGISGTVSSDTSDPDCDLLSEDMFEKK